MLPIGEHAADGDRQRLLRFLEQSGQIRLARAQETPGEEDFPGQTVPQDPDDLMPHVRLQAIEGEQHAPLLPQALLQPVLIG